MCMLCHAHTRYKNSVTALLQIFYIGVIMTLKQYKTRVLLDPRSNKLNFEPDRRQHEVYRITHTQKQKHYYGSKSNNKILGESYISSSTDKHFIQEQNVTLNISNTK